MTGRGRVRLLRSPHALEDFGLMGASVTSSRRSGGTDSTSFNEAGLPGIGLGQDPIQYNSHTWHTKEWNKAGCEYCRWE